jgi:hypothetical protein
VGSLKIKAFAVRRSPPSIVLVLEVIASAFTVRRSPFKLRGALSELGILICAAPRGVKVISKRPALKANLVKVISKRLTPS